jgi:hypothetical protein
VVAPSDQGETMKPGAPLMMSSDTDPVIRISRVKRPRVVKNEHMIPKR